VNINYYSGGGTDMRAGPAYFKKHGIELAAFVCLTDGYTPFPNNEDIPSIWCISSDVKAPPEAGETVHFQVWEKN
jgi:predicted metal-dependent peptidase